ncbi:MAG: malto-oligosyltrehalose trehalohydrolase [Polyangia bacterium]
MSARARLPVLGAQLEDGATRFGLFSTTARSCAVQLYGTAGERLAAHAMTPVADGPFDGYFECLLPGVGRGARYRFVLDERELPDPYARFLPEGVHGPAEVVPLVHRFVHPNVARPLREHVLYELHVGTFTAAGTYAAAMAKLPLLVELGVSAVELLPLAAFAGRRGWGYDGVALFAPFAPYGTPDELCAFIDCAHGLGLAVILDVVYNHFGPAGNYLSAYSPQYFTSAIKSAWGDAPDFAHPAMRRLVLDNALYWLRDFRFDGLRLDATHTIVDPSSTHVLRELAEQAALLRPHRLLIAEDERNEPALVTELGLDAIWADDFHHAVHTTLTAEQDGYYCAYPPGAQRIADAITSGWSYRGEIFPLTKRPRGKPAEALPAEAFVYCLQNHDQIGNRALGERLNQLVPPEAYALASALLLLLPMTPLLFMGQEWAASSPFRYFTDHDNELGRAVSIGRREEFKHFAAFADPALRERIPDPQADETFRGSALRWDERELSPHRHVLALYTALIRLRREDPVLRTCTRGGLVAQAHGELLVVRLRCASGERTLLANFSAQPLRSLPAELVDGQRVLFRTGPAGEDLRAGLAGYEAALCG